MSNTRREGPRCYNPALVRLPDGTYGTFPFGHPMPEGAVVIERRSTTGWRKVRECEYA